MRPGCYNINTGRVARKRHAKKTPPVGEVSSDKERGRGKKGKSPLINTLALHSIRRWRTKSQPFAVKIMVPVGRFELPTHSLKGYCSSN